YARDRSAFGASAGAGGRRARSLGRSRARPQTQRGALPRRRDRTGGVRQGAGGVQGRAHRSGTGARASRGARGRAREHADSRELRRHRERAPSRAGRSRAGGRADSDGHESERPLGAYLHGREPPGRGAARAEGDDRDRHLSEQALRRRSRVYRLASGVHAEERADDGRTREARVRGEGAHHRRSPFRVETRHAGGRTFGERGVVSPGPAVVVEKLARRFGAVRAVDAVSFEVRTGELYGLVGPDGAGKTTLLRMLAGVLKPTGGDARIFGDSVARAPEAVKHDIAYMPQRFGLYADLTVSENLAFYADLYS